MNNINNLIDVSNFKKYKNDIQILLDIHEKHLLNINNNSIIIDNNIEKIKNSIVTFNTINKTELINLVIKCIHSINNINYNYLENKISNSLNKQFEINKLENIITSLKENDVYILEKMFSKEQCNKIITTLNNKIYSNKVTKETKKINILENNNNIWWNEHINEIYELDFIQEFITNKYLLHILQDYLGTEPIFFSSNFWASYPGKVENTEKFHQDYDDTKFLKLFIYINDVTINNGPHSYIKKSLKNIVDSDILKNYKYRPSQRLDENIFIKHTKNDIINITGNEGTLIIENTKGFHKGTNVKQGKRYILQLLFGTSAMYYYQYQDYQKIFLNKNKSSILYKAKEMYPYIYQNFIFK